MTAALAAATICTPVVHNYCLVRDCQLLPLFLRQQLVLHQIHYPRALSSTPAVVSCQFIKSLCEKGDFLVKILVDFPFYELSEDIICLQPFLPTNNANTNRCVHSRSTSVALLLASLSKQYRGEPRVCIIPWILPNIHILFS